MEQNTTERRRNRRRRRRRRKKKRERRRGIVAKDGKWGKQARRNLGQRRRESFG